MLMKVMQIQDEWGPEHIRMAERVRPEPGQPRPRDQSSAARR